MPYSVYILFSEFLNCYYVGSAQNPEERLKKHLSNHAGFTGKAKDWRIVLIERYGDKSYALNREKQLKNWKSRVRIEELIKKTKQINN